jgi:hypothetical protein
MDNISSVNAVNELLVTNFNRNFNFLQPDLFRLQIVKIPDVVFFTQELQLPGISLPPVEVPNPLYPVQVAGDHVTYDPFELTFKVDSSMVNYFSIYNWITQLGFPKSTQQYVDIDTLPKFQGKYSDAVLTINNIDGSINKILNFINLFPTRLSGLKFVTDNGNVNYLTATASFRFQAISLKTSGQVEKTSI